MANIELAPKVLNDFQRILDHLTQFAATNPSARIADIIQAIDILTHSPLIGRPVTDGPPRAALRELIIGRAAQGYVALYRFIPSIDTVFVLALRHQREETH